MLLKGKEYIKISFLCLLFAFSFQQITAQETSKKEEKKSRSLVRKAERAKSANDFSEAEAAYRRALSKDLKNAEASYNFGHLYGDKEMEMESMSQLLKTAKNASSKELKHKAFHNLGNTYMKQKDYAQAVNAYKDALRNNPADEETRYNWAVAQEMLEIEGRARSMKMKRRRSREIIKRVKIRIKMKMKMKMRTGMKMKIKTKIKMKMKRIKTKKLEKMMKTKMKKMRIRTINKRSKK